MRRIILLVVTLVLSLGLAAWSQEQPAGTEQKKTIKKVPVKDTAAHSGKEMYMEYCAACHGKEGKGDGPAASALKVPPPDLSVLAKRNDGKYPADHVTAVLRFGTEAPAHGTIQMPIWGHLFWSASSGDRTIVAQRIYNLNRYLESLQSK